jgi:DNA-binding transcriptional ArsR family regulator
MPLLAQWVRQRPWLSAGLVGAAGGVVGIASGVAAAATAVGAFAVGSVSSKSRAYEHPLRQRILSTLEQHPGLCYRELQSTLNAANGTLRHHLDVLQTRRSVTVLPVNGRTCYFAGAPSQVEILRGIAVTEERCYRTPDWPLSGSETHYRRHPERRCPSLSSRTRSQDWPLTCDRPLCGQGPSSKRYSARRPYRNDATYRHGNRMAWFERR